MTEVERTSVGGLVVGRETGQCRSLVIGSAVLVDGSGPMALEVAIAPLDLTCDAFPESVGGDPVLRQRMATEGTVATCLGSAPIWPR